MPSPKIPLSWCARARPRQYISRVPPPPPPRGFSTNHTQNIAYPYVVTHPIFKDHHKIHTNTLQSMSSLITLCIFIIFYTDTFSSYTLYFIIEAICTGSLVSLYITGSVKISCRFTHVPTISSVNHLLFHNLLPDLYVYYKYVHSENQRTFRFKWV